MSRHVHRSVEERVVRFAGPEHRDPESGEGARLHHLSRELADFTRVDLDPGEAAAATFEIRVGEFAVLGPDGRRRVEPETFTVRVGDLDASFEVEDRQ